MKRAVRYAASTLIGPWTFLVVLGVDLGIAAMRGSPYLGEGMWTVRWMAIGLWMLWPVAAAAAAVDAGRLSRPGARHLVLASRRGWRQYPWAAAWTALPMAAAHSVFVFAVLLFGGVTSPRVGWLPILLAVLAQAVTFVFFACLGSFLGRHLPVLVAGVVAGVTALVTGYTLTGTAAATPRFEVLGDSGATVSQIGVTWNTGHLAAQIVILGALSVLLVLPRPQSHRGVLAPTRLGLAAAIGCVAVIVVAPAVVAGTPLTAKPEKPDTCLWAEPVICYYPEHARFADPTVAQISALADAARSQGYDSLVPERVEERSRRDDPANGRDVAAFDTLESDRVDLPVLVEALLRPAWCPQLSDETAPLPDSYTNVMIRMIDTWTGLVDKSAVVLAPDLPRLSPEQVAEVRTSFARCELDVRP